MCKIPIKLLQGYQLIQPNSRALSIIMKCLNRSFLYFEPGFKDVLNRSLGLSIYG